MVTNRRPIDGEGMEKDTVEEQSPQVKTKMGGSDFQSLNHQEEKLDKEELMVVVDGDKEIPDHRKYESISKRPSSFQETEGTSFKKTRFSRKRDLLKVGAACLSQEDIARHVENVTSGKEDFRAAITHMHRRLFEHRKNKGIFNVPVDPVLLQIPTYFEVIKNPMDLGTIKTRIENDFYSSPEEFARDVRLVYHNALKFNHSKTFAHQAAKVGLKQFESDFSRFEKDRELEMKRLMEHSCESCNGQHCELCGKKCAQFQEPVLRCSAPCKARIHRNSVYYRLGGDRGQHWCNKCYTSLPEQFIGILGQTVEKAALEKRVHNEVFLEPWVTCRHCDRTMHQICTFYHPSLTSNENEFRCIICVIWESNLPVQLPFIVKPLKPFSEAFPSLQNNHKEDKKDDPLLATSLPQTKMGAFLEERVKSIARNYGGEELAESLTLRVVSSQDCTTKYESHIFRWVVAQRESCKGAYDQVPLHSEFPCRNKTVILFQRIHGVDILLFVLYVQEYSNECPEPNRNKVYVSYLDSVAYLTPAHVRTFVYQEVMISYLTWVKRRGFERAYIWACPPQRGDAYIIYCHPKWQRNPGAERLRKWYAGIFGACRQSGIVERETNVHDQHLSQFRPLVNTRASRSTSSAMTNSRQPVPGEETDNVNITPHTPPTLGCERIGQIDGALEEPTGMIENSIEEVPYFYGDFLPNEVESMLTILLHPRERTLSSSYDEEVSLWWKAVWGPRTEATLLAPINQTLSTGDGGSMASGGSPTWKLQPTADLNKVDLDLGQTSTQDRNDWLMRRLASTVKPMAENFIVLMLQQFSETNTTQVSHNVVTEPDVVLSPNLFDTRLDFLDVCKHHNLQFDQLRRAKMSSLVLLGLILRA